MIWIWKYLNILHIPDFHVLLVSGFPCQNFLQKSKGTFLSREIEGQKVDLTCIIAAIAIVTLTSWRSIIYSAGTAYAVSVSLFILPGMNIPPPFSWITLSHPARKALWLSVSAKKYETWRGSITYIKHAHIHSPTHNTHTHTHNTQYLSLSHLTYFLHPGVLCTVSFSDYNILGKPIQVTQL